MSTNIKEDKARRLESLWQALCAHPVMSCWVVSVGYVSDNGLCIRLKPCYTCMHTKRIWTRLVLTAMMKLKTAISMTDDDGDCVIPGL